jgi:dihydroxyacid dehydratase/phosphogluconate dehydratase
MDAKTFDKKRLPSRHVTQGPERAPHRSYYYAMGLTEEQINQPFVGVVSCWNEARRGERHAARILHDHGHRRHRHGSPGHEVVAGFP